MIVPVRRSQPSWKNGFARYACRSAYPELWHHLFGAWLPSLGPAGLTLRDISGSGKNGALAGSSYTVTSEGSAILFDGNDSVNITGVNTAVAAPITISAWVRMAGASANGFQRIYERGTGNGTTDELQLYIEDDGDVLGSLNWKSATNLYEVTIPGFAYGSWYHVSVSWAANKTRLVYINGQYLDGDTSAIAPGVTQPNSYIGNWSSGGTRGWNGEIAEVLIHGRVLFAEERAILAGQRGALVIPRQRVFPVVTAAPGIGGGSPLQMGSPLQGLVA